MLRPSRATNRCGCRWSSLCVTPTIRESEYLAFSAKLMHAFALTFEMPIFACFLTRLGTVHHLMLIRQFRYAILGIFVVIAAITPPGMISQFALAIPLLVLYGVSVGVSYVFRRREEGESESCEGGVDVP